SPRAPAGATRAVPAPHAEAARAGALRLRLSRQVARSRLRAPAGPGRATCPVGPVGRARPVGPATQAVPPARPAAAVAHPRSTPPRRTAPPPPSPAIALASRHRAPPWRRGRAVPFPRSRPPASRKGGTARLHRRVIAGCGRVIAGPGRPHLPGPPRPRRTTSRAGSPGGGPALLRRRRRSQGPPADQLARSRISTSRHRLVAEVGRVSMMRTRSPMPAVFSSSWALKRLVLVVTLP